MCFSNNNDGFYVVIDDVEYKAIPVGDDVSSSCSGCDFFINGTCECKCQDAISVCHCLRKIYRRVYGVLVPNDGGNYLPEFCTVDNNTTNYNCL